MSGVLTKQLILRRTFLIDLSQAMRLTFWSQLFVLIVLTGAVLLGGCQSRRLVLPHRQAAQTPPAPASSVINMPVKINLFSVSSLVDKRIPATLFVQEDMPIVKNVTGKLRVEKNGLARLRCRGRDLIIDLPMKAELTVSWELKTPLVTLSKSETIRAELTVTARNRLGFTPEWTLNFDPEIGYVWDAKPTIKVLGFEIGLAYFADQALKKQIPEIKKQLKASVAESLSLRSYVAPVWRTITQPLALKKKPRNFG